MSSAYSRVWPPNYLWHTQLNPEYFPAEHRPATGFYMPWLMSLAWLASNKKKGLQEVFSWKTVDFDYPSHQARDLALAHGQFYPPDVLPLGLERDGNRLFITLPRWKKGVPASLTTVDLNSGQRSPLLKPYPDWAWHNGDCNGITSVFRVALDECGRLWAIDSGVTELVTSVKRTCPPQILVFDTRTDKLLFQYKIPMAQVPAGSLFTNIAVEVMDTCQDTFAYVSDVFRYGIVVFSLRNNRSWRVDHPYFYPDPLHSRYDIDNIKFTWNDGIFGITMSPRDITGRRYLFFHPLSSFREFHIDTMMLQNETFAKRADEMMKLLGEERRTDRGHAAGSSMDRNGVLFYNLISLSAVGCWNSRLPHYPETQGIVETNNITLSFPNDLKVDKEPIQRLWVLSNRLHRYLYSKLDPSDVNFRVMTMPVDEAVKGTPCDDSYVMPPRRTGKCYGS
ncbi:protein yellow isoform X2 [Halyomorpha halys]|uniref:protein yellow isoform X2 n=1 Tax=Halyomorpha halys TaxID=286706 RepID=UPI0006D5063E|nr:protein yellow isoform X2 [Halyomorpha halys]